jgi:hypothetical protein
VDIVPRDSGSGRDGALRIQPTFLSAPQPCVNVRAPASTRQWASGKVDTKNKLAFSWRAPQLYPGSHSASQRRLLEGGAAAADTADAPAAAARAQGACGRLVVESRVRLPLAAGRWSAVWMMPRPQPCGAPADGSECGAFGRWPDSGEIDILEQVNRDAQVLSTVHFAHPPGVHQWSGSALPLPLEALQAWSVQQLAWDCNGLAFYVNGQQVHRVSRADFAGRVFPFDEPFFLIANTAIGGMLTGGATPDTAASAPFLVDYIRVYGADS